MSYWFSGKAAASILRKFIDLFHQPVVDVTSTTNMELESINKPSNSMTTIELFVDPKSSNRFPTPAQVRAMPHAKLMTAGLSARKVRGRSTLLGYPAALTCLCFYRQSTCRHCLISFWMDRYQRRSCWGWRMRISKNCCVVLRELDR